METRKEKEIEYYDKQADKKSGDFEGFPVQNLSSYKFLYDLLKDRGGDKEILDYGCGNGTHSSFLAKNSSEVIAIDLSENQLEIAKERAQKGGVADKIKFIKMDCEKLDFTDEFFDIIFDGGTFSSLDLPKALPELTRVLKPEGVILGIETFGHNPLTNLKRKINIITGKRTGWAAGHILKMKDLESAKKYFNIQVYFFHLVSWVAFPFLGLSGGKFLLKILEKIDSLLLRIDFLKKYSFKVVFVFSKQK